ncbi:hypothetical protein [Xylanibacter muris]|uniref:Uncharacterized protein n=1 Tax=Xylanibacter muris TaxID=2736290 RepID=A0ABX2AIW0_9BACT|nr:hypothetical protein [Xylanibacter muris]NPD90879.1 hypothetical protein [Xylanibacter muris]
MANFDLMDYLKYNKIETGIYGFNKLLYGGLVIPHDENLLIVIRGGDDTEKTVFSLQLISSIAETFKRVGCEKYKQINYYSNYLGKKYLEDLLLDILISSAIQKLTIQNVSRNNVSGKILSEFFFNINRIICTADNLEFNEILNNPDKMLCEEALYYNNRTNAIHIRTKKRQDKNISNLENLIFNRKEDSLNEYIKNKDLRKVEDLIDTRYVKTDIEDVDYSMTSITDKIQGLSKSKTSTLLCVNIVKRKCNSYGNNDMCSLIDELKKFKVSILVVRDDVDIPEERADMIIYLSTSNDGGFDYKLNNLSIYKSRFQSTAIGIHQYKCRDYGIEVYPSLHTYCQQRRYLQRALVYTHSDVISETFQQYLNDDNFIHSDYNSYMEEKETISDAYLSALSPSAYKNFSIAQVLDIVFINPIKNKFCSEQGQTYQQKLENDFLYGNNGGITAIIGEPNTFKRFLTFGSAFSSAHKKEHTLFLLLNKDSRMVRRRLQCPARNGKRCINSCKDCYKYLHFMNIVLGCISPEEFLYFLMQQIDTAYPDGNIKRIIIDDLQVVEYCFPLLFKDPLFIPALIDECRDREIALYIMCDKNCQMKNSLSVLADNVIYTSRDEKGNLDLFVERYSGYNSKPSKIFAGKVRKPENLFECYEKGSRDNRKTYFDFDADQIESFVKYTMSDYWKK